MKIGEFAKAAGIPASVLRHYDKEGLLVPDYIDNFTGYRYYSAGQIEIVRRIELFKQAGLSLKEIRKLLENPDNNNLAEDILKHRETEYRSMLVHLQEAKKTMLQKNENQPEIFPDANGITEEIDGAEILLKSSPLPIPTDQEDFKAACELLDEEAARRDYQRISGFMTQDEGSGNSVRVVIRAIKLNKEITYLSENTDIPFENDERVIGKWKVLYDYAVKEDFYSGLVPGKESGHGGQAKEIYFLPDGEKYWIYGWTKNYLILTTGDQQCLCRYEIEDHDGKRCMFIEEKGYEFRRGGRPLVLVLEQLDTKRYTAKEIMREDDLDMPFVNDERVLGKWNAYDFIQRKEDFEAGKRHISPASLFFKEMLFEEHGICTSKYGEKTIGPDAQSWTKGYVLRHYNHTACAYEIITADDTDYMIIEWKSGDYRWGGHSTNYYVFVRECPR